MDETKLDYLSTKISYQSRKKISDLTKRTYSNLSISSYSSASEKVDNRPPIIIEIGKRLTKIGFAGEFTPQEIFPTKCIDAINATIKPLFDENYTEKEQYLVLAKFFKEIVFRKLLTTIVHRHVIIVESTFTPTKTRNTIAKALFECPSLSPHAILFAPSHLLCTFPFNANNALVIDIGSEETILIPVAEGCLMLNSYESTMLSLYSVEKNVENLIRKYGKIRMSLIDEIKASNGEVLRSITDDDIEFLRENQMIEDIVVRFCFTTTLERGKLIQETPEEKLDTIKGFPPDVELSFGTDMFILPGIVREAAAEILFKNGFCDNCSIPQIILEILLKVPIDLRKFFLTNLLVVGGIARMNGFLNRIKAELMQLITDPNSKYHQRLNGLKEIAFYIYEDINLELYCGWLGGSLFGSCQIFDGRSITKKEWMALPIENRNVPDWTNRIDDYLKKKNSLKKE